MPRPEELHFGCRFSAPAFPRVLAGRLRSWDVLPPEWRPSTGGTGPCRSLATPGNDARVRKRGSVGPH
ncbi:unnamed protein product [Symbiodinium sp. CCMP2592]|nr:unnamed protein product [Symbiodinium sp. CCMP2592]